MTVKIFTKQEFEEALPVDKDGKPLWEYGGVVLSEHVYHVPVTGTNKRIVIRSSVSGATGVSAGSGEDSIRLWVEYYYKKANKWFPLKKLDAWTTRVTGWEQRVTEKLRQLWKLALEDSNGRGKSGGTRGQSGAGRSEPLAPSTDDDDRNKGDDSVWGSADRVSGETSSASASDRRGDGNDLSGVFDLETDCTSSPSPKSNDSKGDEKVVRVVARGTPNKYQQRVIDLLGAGPQVVEACPGSGKTFLLENLVVAMIESGIDPAKIGVFTFSKSAAAEARQRIAKALWPNITSDRLKFFSDPFKNQDLVKEDWVDGHPARRLLVDWTCTIHALSLRLLKASGEKVKVLSGQNEFQATNIIKDSLAELKWKESHRSVRSYIGWAIRELVTPDKAEAFYSRVLARTDLAWRAGDLAEIYRRYYDFCKSRNLVDFDMMQARVLWKLRNDPTWRKKAQEQFDYILVDEAQDTSAQQAEILWTLAERTENVVFCGDVDQSMYAFRGAHPSVLRQDFNKKWKKAQHYNLPINYRSTQTIIDVAEKLIQYNYSGPDDPYLKPFQARDDAPVGEPVTYTEVEKFADLCNEVTALVIEKPSDWFVLSRTRAECAAIHTELIRQGIPAINKSGGLLFGAPHVRKVLAYARLACDYQDARNDSEILGEIANVATSSYRAPFTRKSHKKGCPDRNKPSWKQYCSCPAVMEQDVDFVHARYWGRAGVDKLGANWDNIVEQSYGYEKKTATKATRDLVQFVWRLEELAQDARVCLNMILADCVLPWLEAEYGTGKDLAENGKAEDLSLLISMVKDGQTIEEYLDEIESLSQGGKGQSEEESVLLGTIHWSKGRESRGVVVNLTRLPVVPPVQKPGKLPMGKPPSIEEERRLAYVAVTRAKEVCHVVASREWNGVEVGVSQFVEEMGLHREEK